MASACSVCAAHIIATDRYRLKSSTRDKKSSLKYVLESAFDISITTDSAICRTCRNAVQRIWKKQQDFTEEMEYFSSVSDSSQVVGRLIAKRSHSKQHALHCVSPQKVQQYRHPRIVAAGHIRKSKHGAALRILRGNASFSSALARHVKKEVAREVRNLCKTESAWKRKTNISQFMEFSWDDLLETTRQQCPLLFSVVSGACHNKAVMTPAMGAIFSQIFFSRKKTMAVLQQMIGVHLWLSGCSRKAFCTLNKLGVCQGIKSTTRTVDILRGGFDDDLIKMRNQLSHLVGITGENDAEEIFAAEASCPVVESCLIEAMDVDAVSVDGDLVCTGDTVAETRMEVEDVTNPVNDASCAAGGDLVAVDIGDVGVIESVNDSPAGATSNAVSVDVDVNASVNDAPAGRSDLALVDGDGDIAQGHEDNWDTLTVSYDVPVLSSYTLCFDNVNEKKIVRKSTSKQGNVQLNLVQCYSAQDRVPCIHLDDREPTSDDVRNIKVETLLPNEEDEQLLRNEYLIIITRILKEQMPHLFDQVEVVNHIIHDHSNETKKKSTIFPLGVMQKDENKLDEMTDVLRLYHEKYIPGIPGQTRPFKTVLFGDALSCERVCGAQRAVVNGETEWDRLEGIHSGIQEWHKRQLLLENTYKLLYDVRSGRDIGTLRQIRNTFRHTNVTDNIKQCFNHATDLLEFATKGYVIAAACTAMGIEDPNQIPTSFTSQRECMETVSKKVLDIAFNPEVDLPDVSQTSDDAVADHVLEYSKQLMHRGLGEMAYKDAIREGDGKRMLMHWKWYLNEFVTMHNPKYLFQGVKPTR